MAKKNLVNASVLKVQISTKYAAENMRAISHVTVRVRVTVFFSGVDI